MTLLRRLGVPLVAMVAVLGLTSLPAHAFVAKTGSIHCERFEQFEIHAQFSAQGYIYVNDRLVAAPYHQTMSAGVFGSGGLQSGSWEVEVEGGSLSDPGTFAFCQNYN